MDPTLIGPNLDLTVLVQYYKILLLTPRIFWCEAVTFAAGKSAGHGRLRPRWTSVCVGHGATVSAPLAWIDIHGAPKNSTISKALYMLAFCIVMTSVNIRTFHVRTHMHMPMPMRMQIEE